VGRRLFYGLLVVFLALAATEISRRGKWLPGAENAHYDIWHQLAGVRYNPEHVVIAVIDEQTRLEHQDEPLVFWAPYFARAVEVSRKAGARIVGLDFLFSVSAEAWLKKLDLPGGRSRTYDLELRRQLASGQVVLAASMIFDDQGRSRVLLPIEDYYYSLPRQLDDVGLTNFLNDSDGVIRRLVTALPNASGETWPIFGALLAGSRVAGSPDRALTPSRIRFAGPPGTFPRLPFKRLLLPGAEKDRDLKAALKDKVVIVALETGLLDLHLTPYARGFFHLRPRLMSGAEVHANIVETLLGGRYPRPLPAPLCLAVLFLVLASATFAFFHFSPWRGLALGAAVLFLCWVLAYGLFLHDLILPVGSLALGLALSFLGVLAVRLTGEERTRLRLRQVFARYVADEVVEKFMASGKLPDLGGEALTVTVLFADIRNFTTISENLSPHEVVELLNAYFSSICEPILEQGGTVDKFMGDAVMAMFGAPAPLPDHAQRALAAALAMADRAQEFRTWMAQRFSGRGLPEFRIGIGLHTGEAVVGNIGSPRRLEYTSIGDTVNIASRLESLTKELGWAVIASAPTIEAAGAAVKTRGEMEARLKGREKAVWVYEVVGLE
jgi:adenylate cyclase